MALNNLGVIAFRNGDYSQATSLFKRSLRFDPDNAGRMVNLAAALFLSGNGDEAQVWLKKALKLNPGSQNARRLIKSMRTP
jgi:Flp pilus assembly protein TadD